MGEEEGERRGEKLTNGNGGIDLIEKRSPRRFACRQPTVPDDRSEITTLSNCVSIDSLPSPHI